MLNFAEIILFNKKFSYRVIAALKQKGTLCLTKSNRTGSGLSELVLLDSGAFLPIVFFI